MNPYYELQDNIFLIEEKIGYTFSEKSLLILAFVHSSFVNENRTIVTDHNERLEFLGDAVLDLVISEYLYKKFSDYSEGELSMLRSSLVDAASCVQYLENLQLKKYVLLSKGEKMRKQRGKDSILADVFEAIVGAIFLDGGFSAAKNFILTKMHEDIKSSLINPSKNYKSDFQYYSQKTFSKHPRYRIKNEEGPDHAKIFYVDAYIGDLLMGSGAGASKKDAEQEAARDALINIEKNDE